MRINNIYRQGRVAHETHTRRIIATINEDDFISHAVWFLVILIKSKQSAYIVLGLNN